MSRVGAARDLAGVLLLGYGLLVLAGILPHDAGWAGLASLALGALLLAVPWIARRARSAPKATAEPPVLVENGSPRGSRSVVRVGRPGLVALLGLGAAGGVLGYNAWMGSGLSLPEVGLLAYGLALLWASRNLERRVAGAEVGTLVAWSFPLLLAPFGMYALNAVLADRTPAPAEPVIALLLVKPLAATLGMLGDHAMVLGNTVVLPTPRGTLSLGVGLVCAGLYPMLLFLGVLGLHGWREQLPPRRFGAYLALGLFGLYLANLLRLTLLAKIGQAWGGNALQEAHANLGWVLFVGFMMVFWGVIMRRLERRGPAARARGED